MNLYDAVLAAGYDPSKWNAQYKEYIKNLSYPKNYRVLAPGAELVARECWYITYHAYARLLSRVECYNSWYSPETLTPSMAVFFEKI